MHAARSRLLEQIDSLRRSFDDIVAATEGANTDDEHDPEGATIAFERAQVRELLRRATEELAALDALDVPATAEASASGDQPHDPPAPGRAAPDGAIRRCEVCGVAIPIERLLAVPQARRCVRCATAPRHTLRS